MQSYNPVPNPLNTHIFKNCRFVILTDAMIRLEWSKSGCFVDNATLAVVNRTTATVKHAVRPVKGGIQIITKAITLTYTGNGASFSKNFENWFHSN